MNLKRWFHDHSLKLLAIRDTPAAIAGGVAIGIFFGFTPLFGLKTLSAIIVAWLTRSNILAAVIATTLHDIIWLFMPVIYLWEFNLGYWVLSRPHHWPASSVKLILAPGTWRNWTTFMTIGKPMLVGSALGGAPVAAAAFLISHALVQRHQRKKAAQSPAPDS
jgi:uncharacterized protein